MDQAEHDPLQPHAHDPNPDPPSADPTFALVHADGRRQTITVADLRQLPRTAVAECYIVSTGHGISGPFTFHGVTLFDFLQANGVENCSHLEVVSADGFGNRVQAAEWTQPNPAGPILLAYGLDGRELTRPQGLVRMIVPAERDDALRQVKWIGEIRVRP